MCNLMIVKYRRIHDILKTCRTIVRKCLYVSFPKCFLHIPIENLFFCNKNPTQTPVMAATCFALQRPKTRPKDLEKLLPKWHPGSRGEHQCLKNHSSRITVFHLFHPNCKMCSVKLIWVSLSIVVSPSRLVRLFVFVANKNNGVVCVRTSMAWSGSWERRKVLHSSREPLIPLSLPWWLTWWSSCQPSASWARRTRMFQPH